MTDTFIKPRRRVRTITPARWIIAGTTIAVVGTLFCLSAYGVTWTIGFDEEADWFTPETDGRQIIENAYGAIAVV